MTFTINKNGELKVPATLLSKMGLSAGDHIRIAYLTEDGMGNTFKEFLLYSEGSDNYGEGQEIIIPSSLLEQANISSDSDIQIACLDGVLIIGTESKLNLSELAAVLEGVSIAVDVTENLPTDTDSLQLQLKEAIDNLRREYES
jgi:antitoxin component of MazEF toxin-antitoxin module